MSKHAAYTFQKPTSQQDKAFTGYTQQEAKERETAKAALGKAVAIIAGSLGLPVLDKPPAGNERTIILPTDSRYAAFESAKAHFEPLYSGSSDVGFGLWWGRIMNKSLGVGFKAYAGRGAQNAPTTSTAPAESVAQEYTLAQMLASVIDALGYDVTDAQAESLLPYLAPWAKAHLDPVKPARPKLKAAV